MSAPSPSSSPKNEAAAMRKRLRLFLAIGIICLISGTMLIKYHVISAVISAILFSIAGSSIAVFISARGGTAIRDEMVKRTDVLSGYYTCNATLYFLFACGIINFFYPLPLSISDLLLVMMLFMSLMYVGTRYFLLRRGVSE